VLIVAWKPEQATSKREQGGSVSELLESILDREFNLEPPDACTEQLKFKDIGVKSFFLDFTADTEITPLETFRDRVIPQLG
jgi:hypothetical protein